MVSRLSEDWEDLCLDPYQADRDEGERLGKEAGLEAGFQDGYDLGAITATDYGMELGFIKGVCKACVRKKGLEDRIIKSVQELERALDDFPGPSQVFRDRQAVEDEGVLHEHEDDGEPHAHVHAHSEDDEHNDSEQPVNRNSSADVVHKMQRIKARFKLLTVQLGIPHFSLKQVMDEAASTGTTVADTSDW